MIYVYVQFQIALWPTENVFVAHWWAMAHSLGTTALGIRGHGAPEKI